MATTIDRQRRSAEPRYPRARGLSEAPGAQQRSIPTRCSRPQGRKASLAGIATHRGRLTWLRPPRVLAACSVSGIIHFIGYVAGKGQGEEWPDVRIHSIGVEATPRWTS